MGIRRLKKFLFSLCQDKGIYSHPTIDLFLQKEKIRLLQKEYLDKNIKNPIKKLQIQETIYNQKYYIGIDANLFAMKYKRVFTRIEFGFLRQITSILSSKIIPIYIFDGSAPKSKQKTINFRQNRKNKSKIKLENLIHSMGITDSINDPNISADELLTNINSKCFDMLNNSADNNSFLLYDINNTTDEYKEFVKLSKKTLNVEHSDLQNLKQFFDKLKIPYLTATNEADDLLALLYKKNIIQSCLSDDTDMLPKGCENLIQFNKDGILQFHLPEILNMLKLNHDQFVDFCVLLGSDYYNTYLPNVEPAKLYELYSQLKHPSIESFIEFYRTLDNNIESHLQNYVSARNSFYISVDEGDSPPKIQLIPLHSEIVFNYLNSIGIILNSKHIKTIQISIKNANQFIMSTAIA